ncbi:MAG: DNRLRE domain-containing protein [Phycisphaeraceae bacterium]|nr:MAG: DNRLRE domain-containing protein [Phycisphaeraceae bacterium]
MKNVVIGAAFSAAACAASLGQVRVEMFPSADATLYQHDAGILANGSGAHAFIGSNLRFEQIRRAVMRFNVAGALPAGAVVVSAELNLVVSRSQPVEAVFAIHRVTTAWSEGVSDPPEPEGQGTTSRTGDCTWVHKSYPGSRWTNPGGDFDAEALAWMTSYIPGNVSFVSTPGFVGLVQGWVDEPGSNFGLLIKGVDESLEGSAKRIGSRENPNVSWRPVLVVRYTVCAADFNGDRFVDFFDFEAFVECLEGGGCPGDRDADFNGDGFVDFFDFEAFVGAFEAGC